MKNSTSLLILLALGLVFVTYKWVRCANMGNNNTMKTEITTSNSTIEDIMTRTSIRSYSDREVTKEQLDTLLRAGMAAPTAVNQQPWRFVVITDKAGLHEISSNFQYMKPAEGAAAAIIACGDVESTFDKNPTGFWIQDVSAATENILLAAHAMGLGAVWCGIYPENDRVVKMREIYGMPENIIPLSCIVIGYPSREFTPKDKWHPEYIHYNKW